MAGDVEEKVHLIVLQDGQVAISDGDDANGVYVVLCQDVEEL